MEKNIKFSENCYRYIIRFVWDNALGDLYNSYYQGVLNGEVMNSINIWSAKTFFSKKDAQETLDTCKTLWPRGNARICKVYMSAPVEEED